MDASRPVGNGFSYQEQLSASKLTSVLEAVAGEYALVINGHSLVRAATSGLSAGSFSCVCFAFFWGHTR